MSASHLALNHLHLRKAHIHKDVPACFTDVFFTRRNQLRQRVLFIDGNQPVTQWSLLVEGNRQLELQFFFGNLTYLRHEAGSRERYL